MVVFPPLWQAMELLSISFKVKNLKAFPLKHIHVTLFELEIFILQVDFLKLLAIPKFGKQPLCFRILHVPFSYSVLSPLHDCLVAARPGLYPWLEVPPDFLLHLARHCHVL
jgi:hypothetical protein